jgi:transcriptional regulator with XRE-family HTH domain
MQTASKQTAKDRVKQKLREKGLNQSDLARRVGCTRAFISQLLSGIRTSAYFQTAIAEALGADPATLWGDQWWYLASRRRAERSQP